MQLETLHPRAARRAVRADAVIEHATVARVVLARRPAFRAPLELDAELIVLELVSGSERAPDFARHAYRRRAILGDNAENFFWIVVEGIRFGEKNFPAREVFAVEERVPIIGEGNGRD